MSKRKVISFSLIMISLIFSLLLKHSNIHTQKTLVFHTKECPFVTSSLPINNYAHPCNNKYSANQSWWSWLSGDSRSINFHYLDLVELLNSSSYTVSK